MRILLVLTPGVGKICMDNRVLVPQGEENKQQVVQTISIQGYIRNGCLLMVPLENTNPPQQ